MRLAVIRDHQRKLQAWAAVQLKPGTRTLTRRLSNVPTGSKLNLRVTAGPGRSKSREIIALKVVAPHRAAPGNRAPTSLLLTGSTVAENRPPGTIVGTLTATDPDPADTQSFSLVPGPGADDNASFAIDGATLRTSASFDFETRPALAIRVRVSDGKGATLETPLTIAVANVDEAPAVANTGEAPAVAHADAAPAVATSTGATANTEGATTPVDPALTVSDPDDANIEGAVVRIAGGFQTGDQLVFVAVPGIAGAYDSTTGVLTLTGSAPKADYQSALRSVAYRHAGDNPSASKAIEFTVSDGELASAPATKAIAVAAVNDAPVLTAGAGLLGYTENDPPMAVAAGLTLVDADSSSISGATVRISANYAGAQDVLALANSLAHPLITAVAAGDTLTLSGAASPAAYQSALRDVTYANGSDTPSALIRTISWQATDDGAAASSVATRTVVVAPVDDPPVAVDDSATVVEDSGTGAVGVLGNDTDV
ncbi:MAG: hypothetical protein QOE11_2218, partial [Solirubrobacteraceae bacterium]|nr:hypothetical protein [Solirubrobacteraceae bacterium]